MRIQTKSGRWVILPTPEENARINAGIAADPDARELDEDWFARARPASEVLPRDVYEGLVALQKSRARGRPPVETPKVATAIRLSRRTFRTILQNLGWAFGYNIVLIPVAVAGLLNPILAGAAMGLSSVSVVSNSLRLYRFRSTRQRNLDKQQSQ